MLVMEKMGGRGSAVARQRTILAREGTPAALKFGPGSQSCRRARTIAGAQTTLMEVRRTEFETQTVSGLYARIPALAAEFNA